MSTGISKPLLVSFHTPDDYYRSAAELLRADCSHFGVDHDIVEIEKRPTDTWIDICRRKIPFCRDMQQRHRRPILWLDVDSRLLQPLDVFSGATCDIGMFLRGFRYLRDFDPLVVPRFFAPFALYFNATPRAESFLNLMADIERTHSASATDDYFIHEAWKRHSNQLSVMILPPDLVAHELPAARQQLLYVGISGNVAKFKTQAQQHDADLFTPDRIKAVLLRQAELARHEGDLHTALALYRRCHALDPSEALGTKIEQLIRRSLRAPPKVNRPERHGATIDGSRFNWKRWLSRRVLGWRP
jgi:hypothetical protein